jgi:yeast amino acid transporter
MASTGVDPALTSSGELRQATSVEKKPGYDDPERNFSVGTVEVSTDQTHRKLKARHIQLIGIGGTIGTALYVAIGQALVKGGPASLFIAFALWCTVILAVTLCMSSQCVPFASVAPSPHALLV